jgi:hypothetical protein
MFVLVAAQELGSKSSVQSTVVACGPANASGFDLRLDREVNGCIQGKYGYDSTDRAWETRKYNNLSTDGL